MRNLKKIELDETTAPLQEFIQLLDEEPLILTINERPIAAIIPVKNMDLETLHVSTDPDFLAIMEHSRQRQEVEGSFSLEQVRQDLATAESQPKRRKRNSAKAVVAKSL